MSTEEIQKTENNRNARTPVLRWIVLAGVLCAGLWFGIKAIRDAEPAGSAGGGAGAQQGPPPATVIVVPVARETVQEKRQVVGTLRAVHRADVAAQESGAVMDVKVDVGDEVEEGGVILSLDDRRIKVSLEEARSMQTAAVALVDERKAEETRAERDLEMKEGLFRKRAVSESEFLDSQRQASVAAARVKAAEDEAAATASSLEMMEIRLADLVVKAPFTGRVVERHVDPGEWIAPGDPVVTLVSSGTVEAWLNVPERFIGAVGGGENALRIVADGSGISSEAKRVKTVADIDPVTRLFSVVVEIDDEKGAMAPGMSVHAELPVGDAGEYLAVPVDAVLDTFQGSTVFKAVPSSKGGMPTAERIAVVVKFRRDGKAYVESDSLKPGEQVVVEGNERLFPGTSLVIERTEPKEQPKT